VASSLAPILKTGIFLICCFTVPVDALTIIQSFASPLRVMILPFSGLLDHLDSLWVGMDTGLGLDLGPVPLNRVNYYNVTKPPPDGSPEQIWVIPGHTIAVWTFHQEIQVHPPFPPPWLVLALSDDIFRLCGHSMFHAFDGYSVALEYTVHFYQYVQQSNYVIGNYDAHPTQDCSATKPVTKTSSNLPKKVCWSIRWKFHCKSTILCFALQAHPAYCIPRCTSPCLAPSPVMNLIPFLGQCIISLRCIPNQQPPRIIIRFHKMDKLKLSNLIHLV
jgi:hypothetical protein